MTATAHRYEIFIAAPRQRVWDALLGEEFTTEYFHGTRFESTFEPGARFVNRIVESGMAAVDGTIEVIEPPSRLVYTWHVLYDAAMAEEPPGRVEWLLADANDAGTATRVTLRHGDLALSPATWRHVKLGWVAIIDGMKTLLETGRPMPAVDDEASEEQSDVDAAWHRHQAAAANNSAFELLDGRELDDDAAAELMDRVHAASYHWARAAGGTPLHLARAAYMVGKATAVVGRGEAALSAADRYERLLAVADDAADFDHAYVHELRARALAAAGRTEDARAERRRAEEFPIADEDDRAIVVGDLSTGPWFGI